MKRYIITLPMDNASFPPPGHDHRSCVAAALGAADAVCAGRGVRLTALRRRVLELVWESHEPVGAYILLDALRAEGRRAAPPTVYRALEFLREHGLIHRIAQRNAFVGCSRPGLAHAGHFLICTGCGSVAELDDPAVATAIERSAASLGFAVGRPVVEVLGLCAHCRETGHG